MDILTHHTAHYKLEYAAVTDIREQLVVHGVIFRITHMKTHEAFILNICMLQPHVVIQHFMKCLDMLQCLATLYTCSKMNYSICPKTLDFHTVSAMILI